MVECNSCEQEVPVTSADEFFSWLMEQRHKRWRDEFVVGTSYNCGSCGRHFPAKDMIVTTPNADKNYFGKSIIESVKEE